MLTGGERGTGRQIADTLIRREGLLTEKWSYDYGVVWRGMEMLWELTGNEAYLKYIIDALDVMVREDGSVPLYSREEHNLDYLMNGRLLISAFLLTGDRKYGLAAAALRSQLHSQPRCTDGGFWHKKIYPYQMWLDGQHMAVPFYIRYDLTVGNGEGLEDAARQLILAWEHTFDPSKGLPVHGWDESRASLWADPVTGRSAHAWGRAVGWYMSALCDSLEMLPKGTSGYPRVLEIFNALAEKLLSIREDGVWLQVPDCPGRTGNYPESSASCLIDYAILKGARLGLLPSACSQSGKGSFEAIQRHFAGRMRNGELFIAKCCRGAGLGGRSGRDGSFDYYISEDVVSGDLKAEGAYIQAACEYHRAGGGKDD